MKKLIFYTKYDKYFEKITSLIKQSDKKVCYITLNKSYSYLVQEFNKKGIKNFYVVDAISEVLEKDKVDSENCEYITSPSRLDEISNGIKKAIKLGCRLIVFDSLSNMLVYYSENNDQKILLKKFFNSFKHELEEKELEIIFACKKEDWENSIIQEGLSFFNIYEENLVPIGIGN